MNAVPCPTRSTLKSGVRASTSAIANPVTFPVKTNGAPNALGFSNGCDDGSTNEAASKRSDPARPNGFKKSELPGVPNTVPFTTAPCGTTPRVKAGGSEKNSSGRRPDAAPASRLRLTMTPGRHPDGHRDGDTKAIGTPLAWSKNPSAPTKGKGK